MKQPRDHHRDLAPLIIELLDGSPSDEDRAALANLLRSDPQAKAAYLNFMNLHGQLIWRSGQRCSAMPPALSLCGLPDLDHLDQFEQEVSLPSQPRNNRRFVITRRFMTGAIAALIAVAALVLALFFNADTPIATLVDVSGGTLTPSRGEPVIGYSYPAGQYTLDSGIAEFKLANNVTVVMMGDTQLTMKSDMRVALTRGQARFDCPQGTEGFTVDLPDGRRVVDLGTAFRVTLQSDGISSVDVSSGRVQLKAQDVADLDLFAGQAAVMQGKDRFFIDPVLFNAASNDPNRGDDPPGLSVAFDHSKLKRHRYRVDQVEEAFGAVENDKEPGSILMFDGGAGDSGDNIFDEGLEKVDYIAWTLSEPTQVIGYRIQLQADDYKRGGPRSMQLLRFIVDDVIVETFDVNGASGDLSRILRRAIVGQRFRVEFTRTDVSRNNGPRIVEIDAIVPASQAEHPNEHVREGVR